MLLIPIFVHLAIASLGLLIYFVLAKMQKQLIGIKVIGVIMLFYSFFLLTNLYFAKHLSEFYKTPLILRPLYAPLPFISRYSPLIFFIILIYLISGINILRLKNWARILSLVTSGILSGVVTFFILFMLLSKVGFLGPDNQKYSGWILIPVYDSIVHFSPAFFFLFFFIHPKIKGKFK